MLGRTLSLLSVLVLAIACTSPLAFTGPTAEPTQAPTSVSNATASPEPTQTASPTSTSSPARTVTPTTVPVHGRWQALATAVLVANPTLAWSPNGRHILIARHQTNGPPQNQFVDVFDLNGDLVQTFQGYDEAVWLDDQQLVLTTWVRGPGGSISYGKNGQPPASSLIVTLGGQPVPIEQNLADGVSSGHGAIAFRTQKGTAVWTPDGHVTKSLSGYPARWSRDGTRLLIEHPIGDRPGNEWPEIVDWPGLDDIAAHEAIQYSVGGGDINMDLTMSATWRWGAGDRSLKDATFIDLASGKETRFDLSGPLGRTAWGQDELMATTYPGSDATAYAVDGSIAGHWPNVGSEVYSSADGSTFVFLDDEGPSPEEFNLLRNSTVEPMTSPSQLVSGAYGFKLSPDGSRLVIVCISGRNSQAAYLTKLD